MTGPTSTPSDSRTCGRCCSRSPTRSSERQPNPTTCCRRATCGGPRWTWTACRTPRPTSPSSSPGRRSTRCGPRPAGARSTSDRGYPNRCCSTRGDASSDVVLAESVSMAMMVVLETLSPDERAVFVLREVFGFGHDEIASTIGKSTAAVRQMAHRAREHVQSRRKRFEPVDPKQSLELTAQFFATAATGDIDALITMLAPDVVWTADSDGKASAARRPVAGRATRRPAHPRPAALRRRRGPRRARVLQRRARPGAVPRRQPGGRDLGRDHRRRDHPLLRHAQSGEARRRQGRQGAVALSV